MKYKSSTHKSKWIKTSWLLKQPNLRSYVPQTMLFNRNNLVTMLSKFSTVFFKPTGGTGGANIIRIIKKKDGYQIQYNTVKRYCSSMDDLYQKLKRFSNQRSFLLQKGIHLARTNGNPFDLRVMVQKTNNGNWKSTAIFAKIGSPEKVATNYNQGGSIGFLDETLSGAGYSEASIRQMEQKLLRLGVSVGKNFERHLKGMREIGLDVALDWDRRPWILEVNTRPQFYPLKNMKNKKLYRRIISYAKQYGRYK